MVIIPFSVCIIIIYKIKNIKMEANNNNIQTSLTSWEKTVLDNAKMVAKDSDDGKS